MSLQKAGVFRHTTLGTDFDIAVAKAREWNAKLDAHRGVNNCAKATLGPVTPMTVADLFRKYERSAWFTWYVPRTRQNYACFFCALSSPLLRWLFLRILQFIVIAAAVKVLPGLGEVDPEVINQ